MGFKDSVPLRLTLDDVKETLDEYDVKPIHKEGLFGLYSPDRQTIYYNPKMIASEEEFLLTILHEITHNVYEDLGELVTELCAENTLDDEEIIGYLQGYFEKEIERYWR